MAELEEIHGATNGTVSTSSSTLTTQAKSSRLPYEASVPGKQGRLGIGVTAEVENWEFKSEEVVARSTDARKAMVV